MSKRTRRITQDRDVVDVPAHQPQPDEHQRVMRHLAMIRVPRLTSQYHDMTPQRMFELVNAHLDHRYLLRDVVFDHRTQMYLLTVEGPDLPLTAEGEPLPVTAASSVGEMLDLRRRRDKLLPDGGPHQ